MPLDPSFRSRLRDALQQSVVGRPASNPAKAGSHVTPADAGSHTDNAGAIDAGVSLRELRYEPEGEHRHRVDEEQATWIADLLGGWWNRDAGGVCLVVDRQYPADRAHGDAEIGCYAETLARCRQALSRFDAASTPSADTLFAGLDKRDGSRTWDIGPPTSDVGRRTSDLGPRTSDLGPRTSDVLFFDLETTGLSGGAGTCAFLIGYGWFEGGGFRTRQYFLGGYAHEPALLRMAAEPLAGVTLASFNGKTFDVPLIAGRYLFHRVPSPFDGVPHIDLLHPARRLWRYRPPEDAPVDRDRHDAFARYFRATALRDQFRPPALRGQDCAQLRRGRYEVSASAASCALGALEEAVLGFRRTGDVPGAEIPSRYFHYVRTGDARPLGPVLEHNRLDLLSLAALASLVARMIEEGPQAARNAHECLALGRLYERSGAADRATVCYEHAVEGHATADWRDDPIVAREALRRLAVRHRRERRYDDAAAAWQRLLDASMAQTGVDLEALQALAVHHEHRSKDLQTARALVIRALDGTHDPRLNEALRRRLSRIERKLGVGTTGES